MQNITVTVRYQTKKIREGLFDRIFNCGFKGIDLSETQDIECKYRIDYFEEDLAQHQSWVGAMATKVVSDIPGLIPIESVSLLSIPPHNSELSMMLKRHHNTMDIRDAIETLVTNHFPRACVLHKAQKEEIDGYKILMCQRRGH